MLINYLFINYLRLKLLHRFTEAQGLCFCGLPACKLFILYGLNAAPQFHRGKAVDVCGGGGLGGFSASARR